jgi:NADH-quinone oxidoreductase subunit M
VSYLVGLDGYNVLAGDAHRRSSAVVVAIAFSCDHVGREALLRVGARDSSSPWFGTFRRAGPLSFLPLLGGDADPMFFIIGIWGGERRIYATIKFVLYTAFGSILMLAALIYLVVSLDATTGITSFAFADLYRNNLPLDVQVILLSAFGLSFAIKVPMVPLHTWLPDAHVEAPTAGSVILAGCCSRWERTDS